MSFGIHRLHDRLRYGLVGFICGAGSMLAYYIASDVVPTPYGPVETLSMSAEQLEWGASLICIVAVLFAVGYMIALILFERLTGATAASRPAALTIAFYATLIQMAATFCTDAFTRSKVGWGLDEAVSVPIAIAGATLPGLITAAYLLLKSRGRIKTA